MLFDDTFYNENVLLKNYNQKLVARLLINIELKYCQLFAFLQF